MLSKVSIVFRSVHSFPLDPPISNKGGLVVLALTANIRLGWKCCRIKCTSLQYDTIIYHCKSFMVQVFVGYRAPRKPVSLLCFFCFEEWFHLLKLNRLISQKFKSKFYHFFGKLDHFIIARFTHDTFKIAWASKKS